MPAKQQMRSKKKCKAATTKKATTKNATTKNATNKRATNNKATNNKATNNKATTKKATTKKTQELEMVKQRNKVLEAKKVLEKQRILQAKKEDDEHAMEHETYKQDQERKAATKKKRKMEFDAKLTALMGVMDQCLLLKWNSLHPSQPPPASLFVWKCKDLL